MEEKVKLRREDVRALSSETRKIDEKLRVLKQKVSSNKYWRRRGRERQDGLGGGEGIVMGLPSSISAYMPYPPFVSLSSFV